MRIRMRSDCAAYGSNNIATVPLQASAYSVKPSIDKTERMDPAAMTGGGPMIPALDDVGGGPTIDRGASFLSLLDDIGVSVAKRTVVDLGAGYGSLAIAASKAGAARVVAVDVNDERLAAVRRRASAAGAPVEVAKENLLDAAFELPPADVAFLIGIVEYAGLWSLDQPVEQLQLRVFSSVYRLLAPGGVLVFASKNRLWPGFTLGDVHTGQPIVNALPRQLAERLSQLLANRSYRHYIHSPAGWTKMIRRAGFRSIESYVPYLSYQFPLLLERQPSVEAIRRLRAMSLSQDEARLALGRLWLPKAMLMALGGLVHVPLTHGVIITARR